jgi:DNA polymerase III epsilon subunit-like protein
MHAIKLARYTHPHNTLFWIFQKRWFCSDCESTGGKAIYHRIIEIGLLVIENGELIEKWQTFIDPKMPTATLYSEAHRY